MRADTLLDILLNNRGLESPEDRENFLNPSYENLHDPFLLNDMDTAVERIKTAIDNNEKIVIYADYDCDGIPGAVLLNDFFEKIGYNNVSVYIPDRHNEGYGLNMDAVLQFGKENVKLLITIDLGITAVAETLKAKELGIDVIITDHHIPPEIIPRALAIVNPKVGNKYPFDMLCGAGVAFKLVQAMVTRYGKDFNVSEGWEKWLLDMAGLATLSDMVPLKGENRILSFFGMKVLEKTRRPGLLHLLRKMKIDPKHITEDDITFMIAPRLNAASRMDNPLRAYELLSEKDPLKAGMSADHLSKMNDERKNIVAGIMRETKKLLEKREEKDVIVIGNPKWRVGILGLVASKISEEHGKTAFVWGGDGAEMIKGSCRSEGSVNVVALMKKVTEGVFIDFGGHELAGGFSVDHSQIYFLEEKINEAFSSVQKLEKNDALVLFDTELTLDDVNFDNFVVVKKLMPFGLGNPKPKFIFKDVVISGKKIFGKEKNHLEICFQNSKNKTIKAISFFGAGTKNDQMSEVGKMITMIASMEVSYFLGRPELRLRIESVR